MSLKIGVFGAGRGAFLGSIAEAHPEAEVVALCDAREDALARAKERYGLEAATYTDYDRFLEHDTDAIIVANYATEHAPAAVKALDAGKHVLSECLACSTLAEGVALARAVERSGKVYAFAENYCYFVHTQEMRRLYREGVLGQFLYGEGEYVHNCGPIWPAITYGDPDHWRNWMHGTFYCSHSIGPLLTMTGERPVRATGMTTPNLLGRAFGRRGDDMGVILCQMSNGGVIRGLVSASARREPSSVWYIIYGTQGAVENNRWPNPSEVNLYLEGKHPRKQYHPEFPYTPDASREVKGHGGSDFYVMDAFLSKALGREVKTFVIDVYQALDMTIPGLLAFKSACEGGAGFDVPDMRDENVRKKFESDTWPLDSSGRITRSSAHEEVEIPPSVYEETRKKYEKGKS